ncbi:MAG: helix-turn-helix domain-containing protein [Polyangia bacterium]
MNLDEVLRAAVAAEVGPLVQRIDRLTALVEALRPAQWLSVDETAKRLSCSPQTVTAMAKRGELIFRRAGRRLLVSAESIRPADPAEISRLSREARQ